MKEHPAFLVQQQTAAEESWKFVNKLLACDKVIVDVPPDCFIWTGTLEELKEFVQKEL